MAKKVSIEEDICIGCETCVELCADIFALNEESNKAYVIQEEGGDAGCIDEAIASCPVECISYQ